LIFRKFAEIFAIQRAPPEAHFATSFASIVDTGGKFARGDNNIGGKFGTAINDTGGKFATGVK
jgi:hypothetical protein